ncbi:MAG: DUF2892 domain-containing protein [Mycobacterium sp.]
MPNQQEEVPAERGTFGLPKPQGWPLDRAVSLMAGAIVLTTLILGRAHSSRWRILTGFAGANLLLNAIVGWCPASLLMHRLGVPTAAERAQDLAA